jgi:hypothetical protein
MATKNMFIVLLVLTSLLANVTSTRDLTLKSGINVPARVEITSGGLVNCWVVLMELNFCSNELFLTILTGQSNLSLGCCHVIKTISNKCWPSMLTSIGLKPKQDNVVLHGYCDGVLKPTTASVAGSLV